MLLVAAALAALVAAVVLLLPPREEALFAPPLFLPTQAGGGCAFGDDEEVARLADLPKPVADDFYRRLQGFTLAGEPLIAEKGEPFNPTDVVDAKLPMRRLIRAGRSRECLFIWYEHGGGVPHVHAVLYRAGPGNAAELLGNRIASGAAEDW